MLTRPYSIHPPFDRSLLAQNGFTPYEYINIQSLDGTTLNLLHFPLEDANGTVLIVHGLGDYKESFLDRAAALKARGYETALVDLRGHGESSGDQMTMGFRESEDIRAAAQWMVESNRPRPYIVWGISLGASAALLAAEKREPAFDGVIAESPFGSLDETAAHHAKLLFKLPRYPLLPLVLGMFRLRTGIAPAEIDLYRACGTLSDTPVLFVAGEEDRRMPPEMVQRLYDAKPGGKDFLTVPGANHAGCFGADPENYMRYVDELLSESLRVE